MRYIWGLSFMLLVSCSSAQSPEPPTASWQGNMREMEKAVNYLFPISLSEKEFNSLSNRDRIIENAEKLGAVAARLKGEHDRTIDKSETDPSMGYILNFLNKEMATVIDGLHSGKRDYSRAVLRTITQTCVQCHTSGNWGPQFVTSPENKTLQFLSPLEKAELLSATRQYDAALSIYQSALSDKELAKGKPFEWEKAARQAVNIAVRVKRDPDLTLSLLEKILQTPSVPTSLRANAEKWKVSVRGWKDGGPDEKLSDKAKLARAESLIDIATRKSSLWNDQGALINYLHASALLHDFVRTRQQSDGDQAKALYLLAHSYEAVIENRLTGLPDMYYKACIFKAPHTGMSEQCYEAYEDSIFLKSMSDNGPTSLQSVNDYLEYLQNMASSKKK